MGPEAVPTFVSTKREQIRIMETFAQRITKQGLTLALTQREVAQALNVPRSNHKEREYGGRIQGEGGGM